MALLKLYVERNIRDTSISLPDLFQKAGFQVDTCAYKNIQKIISENDINIEAILDIRISGLIAIFNLEQAKDKKTFISMRAVLRKVVIEKMSEPLNISQIKHFNWQQICQVFEEHVGMSDIEQSEKWYTYFEENGINGSVLLGKTGKTDQGILAKKLNLNEGQKNALSKLFTEIQPKVQTHTLKTTQVVTDSSVGVITTGSGKVTTGHITVNHRKH